MSDTNQNKPGLHPLHGYGIAPASPGLKDHVLRAARDAWGAAPPADIPWTGPLLRLAASLIVAAIPVFLAVTLGSGQNADRPELVQQPPVNRDMDDLLAMTGHPEFYRDTVGVAPHRRCDMIKSLLKHQQAIEDLSQDIITHEG
jgi:hypothetical protein